MALCHVAHPVPGKPNRVLIIIHALPLAYQGFLNHIQTEYRYTDRRTDVEAYRDRNLSIMPSVNKVKEIFKKKKGQTGRIQHRPEQTHHYSCNLRQLSQDLYTWSHIARAGNERQGSLSVVSKETNPGAAPLALNDRVTLHRLSVRGDAEKGQANILWVHKSPIHCQWCVSMFCLMIASDYSLGSLVSVFVKVEEGTKDHRNTDVALRRKSLQKCTAQALNALSETW